MIQETLQGKFDWSADSTDTMIFPLQATVLKMRLEVRF